MSAERRAGRGRDDDPLVIGLGNEHRGDDAVGLLVARSLRRRLEGVGRVVEHPTEGTGLLDLWSDRGFVLVVDAVTSGHAPGAVHRIEVGAAPLDSPLGTTSTHGLSLAQAVALGQALDRMPERLVIYGVEGLRFAPGTSVSPEVAAAVEAVSDRIEEEVRRVVTAPAGRAGGAARA